MKKEEIREIAKLLIVPFVLFAIYLSMIFFWQRFGLPSHEELIVIVTEYFSEYGLWTVFISALIEGALLLGQYFPGGFVIFLGVISAAGNTVRAIEVVSVVSLAFFISYYLNYVVGKYGWYKLFVKFGLRSSLENAKQRLTKHGLKAIFFSYWEPNLASITATAAGILKLPTKNFLIYSLVGIAIWNTFWGVLVFKLGEVAMKLTGIKYILIIFVIWVAIIIIVYLIKRLKKEKLKYTTNLK